MKIRLSFILLVFSVLVNAQDNYYLIDTTNLDILNLSKEDSALLDETLEKYHKATEDTSRLRCVFELADYLYSDEVWPKYNELLKNLAEEYQNKKGKTQVELDLFNEYLATAYNNKGYLQNYRGNMESAIENYFLAIKIYEEIGANEGIGTTLNNIAMIYFSQEDYEKALEISEEALAIRIEMHHKAGEALTLQNMGHIYDELGDDEKEMYFYQESLKVSEEIGDTAGSRYALNSIGTIYSERGEYDLALEYFEKSLKIRKDIGDIPGVAHALYAIGNLYMRKNKVSIAKKYAEESYELAQEVGFPEKIMHSAELLNAIYSEEGNWKDAYKMYNLSIKMRDSLKNEDLNNKIFKKQIQFDYEKQAYQDSVAFDNQQQIKDAEREMEQEQEKIVRYSLYGGLAFIALFGIFMYNRFRHTKKQKLIIEEQKALVDHKNKEVFDSINYAKRIQDALLKNEEHESPHLPPHFIYFRPKDIVSGDFYWAHEKQGHLYLSAADCTGHGVPGAFLTMLGTSFLNEINAGEKLLSPAEILDQLRDRFIKELSQSDGFGSSKDGMDISLIRLNLKTNELSWAGANNPLYLITKENPSIIFKSEDRTRINQNGRMISAILPNKQAIGYDYFMKPFTNHTIQLEKGDYLCLFSDGYADQFGGPKGKKFKYKPFKKLLMEVHEKPMPEQKEIIASRFEDWKGNLEQIDDVCVIGIRV